MLSVLVALVLAVVVPTHPYVAPVPDPIIERFRDPACRWCPGNRGLDYAPPAGRAVVAIHEGRVAFAGLVAGRLVVAVVHPDGLRSMYTGLTSVAVAVGQPVATGQAVGTSAAAFQLGVKRGDQYVDPEPLLAGGRRLARLVPERRT